MTRRTWIRYRGLVVAAIAFTITRVFVAEALVVDRTLGFLLAGFIPLVVGLALTVYGVVLAVGVFPRGYVATVSRWCLVGTVGMAGVVVLTSLGSMTADGGLHYLTEAPVLVANVLLAGAVGGVIVGDRSAGRRRERRGNERQANRALFVVRLLRHEVINAAAIADGHVGLLRERETSRPESLRAIADAADRIRSTVQDVASVAEPFEPGRRVDVSSVVDNTIDAFARDNPDVVVDGPEDVPDVVVDGPEDVPDVVVDGPEDLPDRSTRASADERLGVAIRELLQNAVEHGGASRIAIGIEASPTAVEVSISNDGSVLPDEQRELLTSGAFPQYDDPSTGFGLQIVHLLVSQYGGSVTVNDEGITGEGTTIGLAIPRRQFTDPVAESVTVTVPNLSHALVASFAAGVAMGIFFHASSGLLPVIGALYGVERPIIGWITHLFHSAVFGVLFAAGCSWSRLHPYAGNPLLVGSMGVLWGIVLWLVAAGVVMPLWLALVGVESTLPNLSLLGFVGHVLWGAVLGTAFWWLSAR